MKIIFLILFFSNITYANLSTNRISQIHKIVEQITQDSMFNKIEVTFDLEEPSPAGAISLGDGSYRILVNKKIYDSLPKAAQDFIFFS